MIFLQPALLWGLAAAALPILIHLLNRLRYRTVPWGAMMFLLRVTRSATKRSRLRHYLILACRTLALAALALAMARPLTGGWLGGLGRGGAPDAVLILLDRSASMEHSVQPGLTRRAQALDTLVQTPPERLRGSRVVLIESVFNTPREIAALTALPDLDWTAATDTAADWPLLLERALDWMDRHQPGRTELWAVTDAQASNWRVATSAWADLRTRFADQALTPRIRLLLLGGGASPNGNLAIQAGPTRRLPDGRHALRYRLTTPGPLTDPVPAALLAPGTRTLLPLTAAAAVTDAETYAAAPDGAGWAGIELPADAFPGDNTAWFAFAPAADGAVQLYAEDEAVHTRVRHAFRPARASDPHPVTRWSRRDQLPALHDAALVVWQGRPPDGDAAAALEAFLQDGGVVLALPPVDPDADEAPDTTPWIWTAPQEAPLDQPWRLARWEEATGPLAHTAQGDPLPLAETAITRRLGFLAAGAQPVFEQAFFDDQTGAAWRTARGAGRLYALATLPLSDWSELGDGRIWVPLLWRLRAEGGHRLGRAQQADAGAWVPASPDDRWEAVAPDAGRDPRTQAGVYRLGTQWLALNRPVAEDDTNYLTPDDLRALLPDVRMDVTELTVGGDDAAATEISLQLLLLAAAFFTAEALLCLGLHAPVARAATRPPEATP